MRVLGISIITDMPGLVDWVIVAIAVVSQWTTLQHSFNEVMTTQDPQALLQKLTEAQQARGFDVLSFVLSLLQKILQPLVGIAFVVLYIDSRREG